MALDEGTVVLPDGRHLGYARYGVPDGHPILEFHGGPGSRAYDLDGDALRASGATLFTVERPGIGLSDPRPSHTLEQWPYDVAAFTDALGLDTFGVVGTSAGSPYGFATAAALPDRVTALALQCGVGPGFDHPEFDDQLGEPIRSMLQLARQDPDGIKPLVRQYLNSQRDEWLADPDAFWTSWLAGWTDADRRRFEAEKDRWFINLDAAYRHPDAYGDDAINVWGPWNVDLASLRVPVRAWHGDQDPAAPMGLIRLAVEAAGGQVVVCAGEAHYLDRAHHADIISWLLDSR